MAWTYSDWRTYSGTARVSRLGLHLQEVEDKITADLAISGRSRMNHPLTELLKTLEEKYDQIGGNAPRANGRSRFNRIDFLEPQGVD